MDQNTRIEIEKLRRQVGDLARSLALRPVIDSRAPDAANLLPVAQVAHGFTVRQVVTVDSGTWALKTQAAVVQGKTFGVVVSVASADNFTVCLGGRARVVDATLVDNSLYVLSDATPGLAVLYGAFTATDTKRILAVFHHTTNGSIQVLAPAPDAHAHPLSDLNDRSSSAYTNARYGKAFLHYADTGVNRDPKDFRWDFLTPGFPRNFGAGTIAAPVVDDTGAAASPTTWRSTGPAPAALWLAANGDGLIDEAASPQKSALGVGPLVLPTFYSSGYGYLWLTAGGTFTNTRPARGTDTAPVGFQSGVEAYSFSALAGVFFNRLRDLQDVEDLGGANPADGVTLVWDLASKTYKHGTVGTASLADDSVTDAKLRNSGPCSVIGRSANSLGDPADISAGADNLALTRAGGVLAFTTISNAMLGSRPAWSVIANGTNASATPTDIAAASDDLVFGRQAGALGFFQVNTNSIAAGAITTAKMAASGATAASYGASGGAIPSLTIDVSGRITSIADRTLTASDVGAAAASHTHALTGDVGGTTAATVIGALKVQTGMIALNAVTVAQFQQFVGYTIMGTPGSATANASALTAFNDKDVLWRNGTTLAFGGLPIGKLSDTSLASPAQWDVPSWDGSSLWAKVSLTEFLRLQTYGAATAYSANGTHTFTAGKKWAIFEIAAGGGGGAAGSTGTVSGAYAGGGGGEGERIYVITPITAATAAVVVGAGGTGGATPAGTGTDGGDSSVTMNGVVYTAKGGHTGRSAGSSSSNGGLGGDSQGISASVGFSLNVHGRDGGSGRMDSVAYNGSGNITSVTAVGGKGGGESTLWGKGGDGGNAGSGGLAGQTGRVRIFEA